MPSPRAKTLAHLQALVAAATATAAATSVGCGKGKAERKPDDPYGSSGYAVVDPLPPPTIEKPVVPPALLYTGQVKVTTKTEKGGRTVFRLTPSEAAPDLVFDDVVSPATVVKKEQIAKTRELVVTVEKTSQIVVRAHGEGGTFTVTATADDAGTNVTLSQ
jgi:hypothetical protein